MKKIELVVSRFNENLDWLQNVPYYFIITIYNKGKNDINTSKFEKLNYSIKNLENIGREGHTYLYHIISNYKKLSDLIIFTQGDPFFHNKDFIKILKYNYLKIYNLYLRIIHIKNFQKVDILFHQTIF